MSARAFTATMITRVATRDQQRSLYSLASGSRLAPANGTTALYAAGEIARLRRTTTYLRSSWQTYHRLTQATLAFHRVA